MQQFLTHHGIWLILLEYMKFKLSALLGLLVLMIIVTTALFIKSPDGKGSGDSPGSNEVESTAYQGRNSPTSRQRPLRQSSQLDVQHSGDLSRLSEDELRLIILDLAKEDPKAALERLELLQTTGRGIRILKEVVQSYWRDDQDGFLADVQSLDEPRFKKLVFEVLLHGDDTAEATESWLSWMTSDVGGRQMDGASQAAALSALTEKISKLDQSDSAKTIADRYFEEVLPRLKDPDFDILLYDFGTLYARRHPKEVTTLVRQLPSGPVAGMTLERAITEAARIEPDVVGGWMASSESFSDLFLVEAISASKIEDSIRSEDPAESQAAIDAKDSFIRMGYDRALRSYAYGLMDIRPEEALEAAQLISDLKVRQVVLDQVTARKLSLESVEDKAK